MNFDWEKFKHREIAVHCDTEDKAKDFVEQAFKNGFKWGNVTSYTTYFSMNKEKTCYSGYSDGSITYDNIEWFVPQGFKIVDWEIENPNLVSITIDPRDAKSAHTLVDAAITQYKKQHEPQDWTEEEIAKAKELSHSMLCEWFDKGYSAVFYELKIENTILVKGGLGTPYIKGYYKANPTHNDFFNADIGKCVALCKLTNHKVPDFILDKNK